ncbi:MAG: hypothetical protein JO269_09585 [Burkholderiaceae bacterium]|nr:hypothetical protein [Burkholderiaceae bacterium]
MGKLTAKARDALPKSDFGLPGSKGFPMQDANHAKNAKARATQSVNSGRMGKSAAQKIDAKANGIINGQIKRPMRKSGRGR